jgi:hypothetical protein
MLFYVDFFVIFDDSVFKQSRGVEQRHEKSDTELNHAQKTTDI